MRSPDKFRGCLIGGAAGDALGYAVEFDRYKETIEALATNESFIKIELGLFESESEIVAARKYYNDIITDYNKMVKSLPSNFVALVRGYKTKAYFDGNDIGVEGADFNL